MDPYKTLGVPRDASDLEVLNAFRRLEVRASRTKNANGLQQARRAYQSILDEKPSVFGGRKRKASNATDQPSTSRARLDSPQPSTSRAGTTTVKRGMEVVGYRTNPASQKRDGRLTVIAKSLSMYVNLLRDMQRKRSTEADARLVQRIQRFLNKVSELHGVQSRRGNAVVPYELVANGELLMKMFYEQWNAATFYKDKSRMAIITEFYHIINKLRELKLWVAKLLPNDSTIQSYLTTVDNFLSSVEYMIEHRNYKRTVISYFDFIHPEELIRIGTGLLNKKDEHFARLSINQEARNTNLLSPVTIPLREALYQFPLSNHHAVDSNCTTSIVLNEAMRVLEMVVNYLSDESPPRELGFINQIVGFLSQMEIYAYYSAQGRKTVEVSLGARNAMVTDDGLVEVATRLVGEATRVMRDSSLFTNSNRARHRSAIVDRRVAVLDHLRRVMQSIEPKSKKLSDAALIDAAFDELRAMNVMFTPIQRLQLGATYGKMIATQLADAPRDTLTTLETISTLLRLGRERLAASGEPTRASKRSTAPAVVESNASSRASSNRVVRLDRTPDDDSNRPGPSRRTERGANTFVRTRDWALRANRATDLKKTLGGVSSRLGQTPTYELFQVAEERINNMARVARTRTPVDRAFLADVNRFNDDMYEDDIDFSRFSQIPDRLVETAINLLRRGAALLRM